MKYKKAEPSTQLLTFLKNMTFMNYEFLTKVVINTKSKIIELWCEEFKCELSCEIGVNGFTSFELSVEGDSKTPICETKVRHIDLPISNINSENEATVSKTVNPPVNFGPCFICLYIKDLKTDKIRGIGIHGSEDDTDGTLLPTLGCIRMYNADLFIIKKLFYKNLKVLII